MIYTKRWQVARLFLADKIGKGNIPKESDWRSWEELEKLPKSKKEGNDEILLFWAKDMNGNIYQAFSFKDGLIYHANDCKLAEGITHVAKTMANE